MSVKTEKGFVMKKIFYVFILVLLQISFASGVFAELKMPNNVVYLWMNGTNSTNSKYYKNFSGNYSDMGYEGNFTAGIFVDAVDALISWNSTHGGMNATLEHKPDWSESWLPTDNSTSDLNGVIIMNNNTGAKTVLMKVKTRIRLHVQPGNWYGGYAEMGITIGPRLGRK